jgi:cation:H+ antiporter
VSVGLAVPVFVVCVAAILGASLVFGRKLDRVSERLGVSEGLHGILTALGADAPEISTAVAAIAASHEDAGVGVVIGASTFNLAALLGVSALVAGSVAIHRHGLLLNGLVGLAVVGIGTALLLGSIGAWAAILLIAAVFVPYVALLSLSPQRLARVAPASLAHATREEVEDLRSEHLPRARLADAFALAPSLAVIVGASIGLVKAATTLGSHWGVPDVVLGTLVLASLTTLPNLITAVRLALHGRGAAVVSETFNSNSLNVLAGLVVPALFVSLGGASGVQVFSAWWLLGTTVLAVALTYAGRGLGRVAGAGIVLLYVPFVTVMATR